MEHPTPPNTTTLVSDIIGDYIAAFDELLKNLEALYPTTLLESL